MLVSRPSVARVAKQQRCQAAVSAFRPSLRQVYGRRSAVQVRATASDVNPVRQAISSVVSGIYKATATLSQAEPGLTPLWTAIKKLDVSGVNRAAEGGADLNERDAQGDTPLLFIARQGHYKYPPSEIPAALVKAGADMEARDKNGLSPLEVSLLSGWQNIAELLIQSGASTKGVAAIKSRITCPDCKRVVAKYSL